MIETWLHDLTTMDDDNQWETCIWLIVYTGDDKQIQWCNDYCSDQEIVGFKVV